MLQHEKKKKRKSVHLVIASCIKAVVKRATIFKVKVDILNTGTWKEVELKRIAGQKLTNNLYHHLIICSKLPKTSKHYRLFLAYLHCDNYSSKAVAALPGEKESPFFKFRVWPFPRKSTPVFH